MAPMKRLGILVLAVLLPACGSAKQTAAPGTSDSPASRPACARDQLTLSVTGDGAGGGLVPTVEVKHAGAPCHLVLTLTLTIEEAGGRPLVVTGNPARTALHGDLPEGGAGPSQAPAGRLGTAWWWRNWCGAAGPFTYRATTDLGLEGRTQVPAGPRCDASGAPSTLDPLPRS